MLLTSEETRVRWQVAKDNLKQLADNSSTFWDGLSTLMKPGFIRYRSSERETSWFSSFETEENSFIRRKDLGVGVLEFPVDNKNLAVIGNFSTSSIFGYILTCVTSFVKLPFASLSSTTFDVKWPKSLYSVILNKVLQIF